MTHLGKGPLQPRATSLRLDAGITIHALYDGGLAGAAQDYIGIETPELEAILTGAGEHFPPCPDLICYLVEANGRRVLVDTGAGAHFGPSAGLLPASMALMGITPGDIDTIFLTHLHGDHVGGLVDPAGAPIFPKAAVRLAREEARYWLESPAETIPQARQNTRAFAIHCLAPYRATMSSLVEEDEIFPGIALLPLTGHTPGQSGLGLQGSQRRLMIVADLLHLPEVQLGATDVTTRYDWRPDIATQTRRNVLRQAASEGTLLAGMHLRWPGIYTVEAQGEGFRLHTAAVST